MRGRVRRKQTLAALAALGEKQVPSACALCGRPLGSRTEWHHVVPKSEGGRETVPLHPICHRAIHAHVANAELARRYPDPRRAPRAPRHRPLPRLDRRQAAGLPRADADQAQLAGQLLGLVDRLLEARDQRAIGRR